MGGSPDRGAWYTYAGIVGEFGLRNATHITCRPESSSALISRAIMRGVIVVEQFAFNECEAEKDEFGCYESLLRESYIKLSPLYNWRNGE
eukprot:scaffold193_cov157-Skeletonema_menzelii.AAC.2